MAPASTCPGAGSQGPQEWPAPQGRHMSRLEGSPMFSDGSTPPPPARPVQGSKGGRPERQRSRCPQGPAPRPATGMRCGSWAEPAEAGTGSASKSTWPDGRVTAASGHPGAGICTEDQPGGCGSGRGTWAPVVTAAPSLSGYLGPPVWLCLTSHHLYQCQIQGNTLCTGRKPRNHCS